MKRSRFVVDEAAGSQETNSLTPDENSESDVDIETEKAFKWMMEKIKSQDIQITALIDSINSVERAVKKLKKELKKD